MTSAASPSPARERLARPGPIAEQHFPDRGRPLAPSIRRRLEPELGVDLSTVRLHTSGEAGELAHRLSARAFTLGNHIVLGRESDLQSHAGQRLLAHELGHLPEQASAAPQIRRSPYSIDPTLAQQGTTAPELVPSLESTKAAMALLNADERELYVAAVREWVSACGHGQELLEIVQQIHSPLVGPQPDDWFPESIRRQVAALPAATIYSPFKVLAIIEVSRNLAAQGVGPQLTTPTLTVPSPAASQQQGTQLAQPQSLASLTPASNPFGFNPSLAPPPPLMLPPKAGATPPTTASLPKLPKEVPIAKHGKLSPDGAGFSYEHNNPKAKHSVTAGLSADFDQGRNIKFSKSKSEQPSSDAEGGPDSFDLTLKIAMTHQLTKLSKLSWSAAGGSNGGKFEISYEFGKSKQTKVVTLDGTVAAAAKAAAEFVDEAKKTLDEGIGDLETVADLGGKIGSTAKTFEPLVKPKQVPIFKVEITVQHELFASADKNGPAAGPDLMTALRGDPRYSPFYLDSMSKLLGSAHGVGMIMIQFEINF